MPTNDNGYNDVMLNIKKVSLQEMHTSSAFCLSLIISTSCMIYDH